MQTDHRPALERRRTTQRNHAAAVDAAAADAAADFVAANEPFITGIVNYRAPLLQSL